MGVVSFLSLGFQIDFQVLNNALALQVPDLNTALSGSTEPVPVGAETKSMNNRSGIQRIEPLTLGQVPQQNNSVFASAGAQRAVRRNRHRVHITGVASESDSQLAIGQVPNLDGFIPRRGNNRRLQRVRAESNTANPVSVSVAVLNGVLALAESVPQLDRPVTRGRDDLAIVDREGDGENILRMSDESTGGDSGGEVPEAELAVPGAGERELAVG